MEVEMVPGSAKTLLNFIGEIEADGKYNAIYGFNQHKLPRPLVSMSIAEVQQRQPSWTREFRSSAAGKYQIMYATLGDLIRMERLSGRELFDANMQDRLGYALLRRRGFDSFMAGRLSLAAFGKNLAMEWASFPVLADTRGAHRWIERGESYYAGDAVNKALVDPDRVEAVLHDLRDGPLKPPRPAPVPPPLPRSPAVERRGNWIAVVIFLVIVAAVGFVLWRFVL